MNRPKSWAPAESDLPTNYPSPLTLALAGLAFLVLLAVTATHDVRCWQWAGDDTQRQAACEELRR